METIDFNDVIRDPETISVVGGLLKSNKLYPFMEFGRISNINTVTEPGIYAFGKEGGGIPGAPEGVAYGILFVHAANLTAGFQRIISQTVYPSFGKTNIYTRIHTFTIGSSAIEFTDENTWRATQFTEV